MLSNRFFNKIDQHSNKFPVEFESSISTGTGQLIGTIDFMKTLLLLLLLLVLLSLIYKINAEIEHLPAFWLQHETGPIESITEINRRGGDVLTNGDVIPRSNFSEAKAIRGGVCITGCYRWPQAASGFYEIPFRLDHFQQTSKDKIEWVMNYIASDSLIRFVPHTHEAAHIFIVNGSSCSSQVGKAVDVEGQIVSLKEPNCMVIGTILHELTHVLGVDHEHQRPDRDEYIAVHIKNVIPQERIQVEKEYNLDSGKITTYDYASVMHYSRRSFSRNNQPVLAPLDAAYNTMLDTNRALYSSCDWYEVHALYPGTSKIVPCIPHVAGRGLEPLPNCLAKYSAEACALGCTIDSDMFIKFGFCIPIGGGIFPPVPVEIPQPETGADADPEGRVWALISEIRKKEGSAKSLNLLLIVISIIAVNLRYVTI